MADDDPTRHVSAEEPGESSTHRDDLDDFATVRGLAAGQRLFGRYVLETELGAGGMGVVWRARDTELDEPVALKFLPEVVARDAASVDELKEETRNALRLTHPNIVRIRNFERDGNVAAISMEYVEGTTLSQLRLQQPGKVFAIETLAPLVTQLCAALDYAHGQAKIVHRDLKPANILVARDGVVKVTDFGIARSLAESSTRLTGMGGGDTGGTLRYMSPQQVQGRTPRAPDDLYALGATLYELLTGKPPFFRGDPYSLRMQILEEKPLSMAERCTELGVEREAIPQAWEEAILACLAKDPQDRPKSAGEVAERLGLVDTTKHAKGQERVPLVNRVAGRGTDLGPALPPQNAKRSSRRLVIAGLAALGVVAAGWWFFGSHLPAQRKREAEQQRIEPARAEQARVERERKEAAAKAQREKEDSDYAGMLQRIEAVADGSPRALVEATEPVVQTYLSTAPGRHEADAAAAWAKRRLGWEAFHLANAKGGLIVRTNPADAEVRVGGFALEKGPLVTLREVKIGRYQVTVTAPGYEDFRTEMEVKEYDFAELTAGLVRSTGVLEIESTPAGLGYALQGETPERLKRSGRTPDRLAELPTGSYRVTVQRDGWPQPVVEEATVERQKTALINAEFATGTLIVASDPSGAAVVQNRKEVGQTPYQAENVPGDYAFEVRLKGYKIASVSGTLAAKNELHLNAVLKKIRAPEEGQAWPVPDLYLEMVYIRPGTFTMGSPVSEQGRRNDEIQHSAILTKGFWLGKTVVTQGQWKALMGGNRSLFKNAGRDAPVENVSWTDAMEFCRKLTERERQAGRMTEGYEYTLPTEAQWEYACRAGTTGPFAGSGNLDSMGWYSSNSGTTTHPVAQKQANAWGLYDMHGNVWEWCRDWYGNYPGRSVTDPIGPSSGSLRVYRGGGWASIAQRCRSAYRYGGGPGLRLDYVGFRLALCAVP